MPSKSSTQARPKDEWASLTSFNIFASPPMKFPPLPPIDDERIYKIVTTHSSLYTDKKNQMDLDPKQMSEDYEKLEHVGDALLGAMITVLLHDLFPMLGEGPATTLKGSLVSNATLARISEAYEIPKKLRAHPAAVRQARTQVKTRASMFEAWIAGVFYTVLSGIGGGDGDEEGNDADDESSEAGEVREVEEIVTNPVGMQAEDRQSSVGPIISQPDDELPSALDRSLTLEELPFVKTSITADASKEGPEVSPTIEEPTDIVMKSSISSEPSLSLPTEPLNPMKPVEVPASHDLVPISNLKYRWLAMTALDEWLRPLFTPIAHFALAQLRLESERVANLPKPPSAKPVLAPEIIAEDTKALGSAGSLNVMVQKKEAKSVKYETEEVDAGWRITCVLAGSDGSIVKGEGVRLNQKTAKALAAYRVLNQVEPPEDDE